MESQFQNDPFAIVAQAFATLYPGKCYIAHLDPDASEKHLGVTVFPEDGGTPEVFIRANQPIDGAVEIFAHELAHVAAGNTAESHGPAWEAAYNAIFDEYNRIEEELFPQQEEHGEAVPKTETKGDA